MVNFEITLFAYPETWFSSCSKHLIPPGCYKMWWMDPSNAFSGFLYNLLFSFDRSLTEDAGLAFVTCLTNETLAKVMWKERFQVFPLAVVGTLLPWEQAQSSQMHDEKHMAQLPTLPQLTPVNLQKQNSHGDWQLTTDTWPRSGEKLFC